MNRAWPNLYWQLFYYYLNPAGSYFGAKVGARPEHVSLNYDNHTIYLINRMKTIKSGNSPNRWVASDLIDAKGRNRFDRTIQIDTKPNHSQVIADISKEIKRFKNVAFLRLVLSSDSSQSTVVSRNVYWLPSQNDVLSWDNSTWYYTPISEYAVYISLQDLHTTSVFSTVKQLHSAPSTITLRVHLENKSADVLALFIRLVLVDSKTDENINPPFWSDNYVTLFPKEKLDLVVTFDSSLSANPVVEISGSKYCYTCHMSSSVVCTAVIYCCMC